jgi:hypothetical protein
MYENRKIYGSARAQVLNFIFFAMAGEKHPVRQRSSKGAVNPVHLRINFSGLENFSGSLFLFLFFEKIRFLNTLFFKKYSNTPTINL